MKNVVNEVQPIDIVDWAQFAATHWERSPAVLRTALARPLIEIDYFGALVKASDAWRSGRLARPGDIRMLAGEGQVNGNRLAPMLPVAEDGDVASYVRRISKDATGGWNLLVNSIQQHSVPLFHAARDILDAVYRQAGRAPSGPADCHIIAGAYGEAPTRVHKDTASVMTLLLHGVKRFWIWPYEDLLPYTTAADPLHGQVNLDVDFREIANRATLLEGKAGDILYWPSDAWHCAESDGSPHVTVHIASYTDGNAAGTLKSIISTGLDSRVQGHWLRGSGYPFLAQPPTEDEAHAVQDHESATSALLDQVAREVPARLQAKRLARRSATNFEHPPPLGAGGPAPDLSAIAVDPRFPLFAEPAVDDPRTLVIAVNGHVARVPRHDWLESLLRHVNSRPDGVDVHRFLAHHTVDAQSTDPGVDKLAAAAAVLAFAGRAGGLVDA